MDSIVIELQRDSLDKNIRVSDLLRKAFVVAKKLGIKEFESWINNELQGYTHDSTVPDYRIFVGDVKVWNTYHGCWQPVIIQNTKMLELITKRACGQSIAEIESLYDEKYKNSILSMPFPKKIECDLLKATGAPSPPTLIVNQSRIAGILDIVRNIILNWSLKLEEDGILGESLSFTKKEKNNASKISYNITNFYGPVVQSQIQQDTKDSSQK